MRTTLRPLSIGEMLDRAVALSVRYFVPLALIWAVFIVPLTIAQYFGTADSAKAFSSIVDALSRTGHGADPQAVLRNLQLPQVFNGFTVAYAMLLLFVSPLASAALMTSVSEAYLAGRPSSLAQAYRAGAREWLPLIGVVALWLGLGLLAYVALGLVVLVLAVAFALLFAVSKAFAGIFLGVTLIVATLGIFAAAILAGLALQVSYYTQVIERVGVVRSFTLGIARVFGKTLRRSLVVGLALAAVYVGLTLVVSIGQWTLFGILHSNVLGLSFAALVGVAIAVFINVFMCLYYYDIRVRIEGFDLQLAIAPSNPAVVSGLEPPA